MYNTISYGFERRFGKSKTNQLICVGKGCGQICYENRVKCLGTKFDMYCRTQVVFICPHCNTKQKSIRHEVPGWMEK